MYTKKVKDEVIDLTDITDANSRINANYVCDNEECNQEELVFDPTEKFRNPHAGPTYYCPRCQQSYDSSLVKLRFADKPIRPIVDHEYNTWDSPIETIEEDLGDPTNNKTDEYEKYNPEPGEDEHMKAQGFHIVSSEIELTDSEGRNRTIVRRDSDRHNRPTKNLLLEED